MGKNPELTMQSPAARTLGVPEEVERLYREAVAEEGRQAMSYRPVKHMMVLAWRRLEAAAERYQGAACRAMVRVAQDAALELGYQPC